MRWRNSRGLIVVALAAASLLAAPLAGPADAAAPPATCNSPKSVVNIKKLTATFTLTNCTNPTATGGSGSAEVNFKTLGKGSTVAGTITWHGTGTTTFSLSTAGGKTPNKCPKGTSEFISTGKVQGGSGAALKGIPKGSPVSETTCSNPGTGASTIYPGTKFVV
jgi:hypothetical protein